MIRFFIFILFALSYTISFAQAPYFKTYSVEDGLPQSEVVFGASIVDSIGNIWMGTNGGGLAKLSGEQLTTFTKKDGLPSNQITALDFDKDGNLWILTGLGVAKYDGLKFTHFSDRKDILKAPTGTGFTQLLVDKENRIWIKLFNDVFLLKDTVFEHISAKQSQFEGQTFPFISHGDNGNILLSTGIGKFYNYQGDSLSNFKLPNSPINEGKFLMGGEILRDGARFFIATDKVSNAFSYHSLKNGVWSEFPLPDYFPANFILGNLLDSDGNYWIASFTNGVLKYDGKEFTHYSQRKNGFPLDFVSGVLEDHEKNIWAFTRGAGFVKIPKAGFINFTLKDGLPGNLVFSTYEDSKGLIWIGTNANGFCTWDGKQIKTYTPKVNGRITNFYEEENGNMLICSRGTGLYRFDGRTTKHVNEEFGLPAGLSVYEVFDDGKQLFISTFSNGVFIFDKKLKKITRTITTENGLSSDLSFQTLQAKNGDYWLANLDGLDKFNGDTTIALMHEGQSMGIILQMVFADNDDLWAVSYYNGLYRIRGEETKFYDFPDFNTALYYSITKDSDGNLWMGTQKGLLKIELDKNGDIKRTIEYGKSDGLNSVELNGKAAYTDRSGNLWFGHLDGVSKYTPTKKSVNQTPTPTVFTNLRLFFNTVNWTDEEYKDYNSGLTKWSGLPKKLKLPYDQNHLTFEFASLSYILPEKAKRQWMLKGADEKWLPFNKNSEATYSNIQPGKYTFKVRSMNNDGVVGKTVEFDFEIEPPFWETWWFRILAFLIVAGTIYILVMYRLNALKQQRIELERLVQERTKDLEKKNDEVMLKNAELEQQKEEILTQTEEIEVQNLALSTANEEIIGKNRNITASINYAKRIQESMLPKLETISENIPNSFVIFQPRDTVSGDFYWFEKITNRKGQKELLIAAADCTGHGVPGAFMSMAGDAYLNLAVRGRKIFQPDEILKSLDSSISKALKQRTSNSRGMEWTLPSAKSMRKKKP